MLLQSILQNAFQYYLHFHYIDYTPVHTQVSSRELFYPSYSILLLNDLFHCIYQFSFSHQPIFDIPHLIVDLYYEYHPPTVYFEKFLCSQKWCFAIFSYKAVTFPILLQAFLSYF